MKCFSAAVTVDTILQCVTARDFQRPVTVEDIESIVNSPKESRGAYAALANAMKQKDDTEILKVLWD